ncbi:hypothetical protein HPP92_024759 [Vanilla planifolia]|uniref:Holliday junction resolvase MOC1, chloroplastic n=1 Tax=Vanilla planifolia TaxID=51239 RepID=A0A835PGL6_VANPL|nr:hypothetical protein HPP92_024759 [Vanilla planifolia]
MNSISSKFVFKLTFFPANIRFLSTVSLDSGSAAHIVRCSKRAALNGPLRASVRVRTTDSALKEDWLDSLSCPSRETGGKAIEKVEHLEGDCHSPWVIGIDPDVSGALAILKEHSSGCTAQVFDTPYLRVLVGKRARKRLDAKSIAQLLCSFGAPHGTLAYIEESRPYPKDGKQGWWSGGFTYGLWIGILVASGFSVVPVSSRTWKDHFQLCGSSSGKDDSRKAASILFPSVSDLLKRKKDHGRAEAILIAAYGKGIRLLPDDNITRVYDFTS